MDVFLSKMMADNRISRVSAPARSARLVQYGHLPRFHQRLARPEDQTETHYRSKCYGNLLTGQTIRITLAIPALMMMTNDR